MADIATKFSPRKLSSQLNQLTSRALLNAIIQVAEKRQKLVVAANRHSDMMGDCQKCEGGDRHLFGLYIVALEAGFDVPDIFTDPSFAKSGGGGNFVLSTSTVGYTPVFGGVSAMTPDGYGLFYTMLPKRLQFFISNFRSSSVTDGDIFIGALEQSLRDMRQVISQPQAAL